MQTLNHPPENASTEGIISPATARQAAIIFLVEGFTPEAVREAGASPLILRVADAMEALTTEDVADVLAVLEPEAAR